MRNRKKGHSIGKADNHCIRRRNVSFTTFMGLITLEEYGSPDSHCVDNSMLLPEYCRNNLLKHELEYVRTNSNLPQNIPQTKLYYTQTHKHRMA